MLKNYYLDNKQLNDHILKSLKIFQILCIQSLHVGRYGIDSKYRFGDMELTASIGLAQNFELKMLRETYMLNKLIHCN